MKTTYGNILLNEILPLDMRKYDRVINKKELNAIVADIGKRYPEKYEVVVKQLKDLGDEFATVLGSSFSLDDFAPQTDKVDKIYALYENELKQVRKQPEGKIKDDQLREVNSRIEQDINKLVQRDIDEGSNRFMLWAKVGAKGGMANYRQMLYASGNQVDVKKEVFPHMSRRSLAQGLTPSDFFITSTGARTGVVASFTNVQEPGAYAKELYAVTSDQIITEMDCGTKKGADYPVMSSDALDRCLLEPQGPFTRNTVVTSYLQDVLKKQGLTVIKVRTPTMCEAREGLCSYCFGPKAGTGLMPVIGDTITLQSAQSVAEPLTQMTLSAKHSGGVVGNKSVFEIVTQILHAPENFPGGALLSKVGGVVESVKASPDGGTDIVIDGTMHYATPTQKVIVHKGDKVEPGDKLTEGLTNPKELVDLKDIYKGREYVALTLGQVYKDNGKGGHPKIFEAISRAALNHGVVTDPGDYDFLPEEQVNWNQTRPIQELRVRTKAPEDSTGWRLNKEYGKYKKGTMITEDIAEELSTYKELEVYKNPVKVKPLMVSTERAGVRKDFVSAMNYRNIKQVLNDAVSSMSSSQLHGTSPVPGYAYGAEFGYHEGGKF